MQCAHGFLTELSYPMNHYHEENFSFETFAIEDIAECKAQGNEALSYDIEF